MKVLFLDIDGVVNSINTNFKTEHWPLDRYMAFLVGKIVLDTDCKVVLSSSWRHHPEGIETVEKHIVPIMDKTPYPWYDKQTDHHSTRGEEIQKWLDAHPNVERYAILDDESDMLPEQKDNFFKTTFLNGLTEEIANRVTEHLNSVDN